MKEIIYFLPDEALGVASIIRNLLLFRPEKKNLRYKVIFTRQLEREATWISEKFKVDEQVVFTYSKNENLYDVVKRLNKHVSKDSILVANDGLELRMVQLLKLSNPLVYVIHGDFNYYYGLVNQNQGVIDQYIAYSKFTEQQLFTKIDAKHGEKIKLLYYPVPESDIEEIKEKPTDLLFVGAFNKRKGVQYLYEIYKSIQNQLPNTNFVFVGDGELGSQLKSQFKLESNVVFKGFLKNDEAINEMHKAKVLLFPSSSEGLPNVVVESMKAKCVPVCSDIDSGIPDLIDDEITGFKVPIGDVKQFSECAINVLNDEEYRNQVALKGYEKACNMFNPFQNAENYEDLIVNSIAYKKSFINKTLGGILNQTFLPNTFVKFIRKLNLSPKL